MNTPNKGSAAYAAQWVDDFKKRQRHERAGRNAIALDRLGRELKASLLGVFEALDTDAAPYADRVSELCARGGRVRRALLRATLAACTVQTYYRKAAANARTAINA